MKFGWLIKVLQNLNPPRVGELRILILDGDSHVSATLRLVRELAIFICLSGASDGCPWRNLLHRSICSIPFHAVNLRCPGSALFTGFHLFDFFFTPQTSFPRPHSSKAGGRFRIHSTHNANDHLAVSLKYSSMPQLELGIPRKLLNWQCQSIECQQIPPNLRLKRIDIGPIGSDLIQLGDVLEVK